MAFLANIFGVCGAKVILESSCMQALKPGIRRIIS